MEEFNRKELIDNLAEYAGADRDVVEKIIMALPTVLAYAIALPEFGNRVEIKDFGTFNLVLRAARHGVTPDGLPWTTPERMEVVFSGWPTFTGEIARITNKDVY